jgi:CMP-N,N'-diacetyllegionaminic acid synthase
MAGILAIIPARGGSKGIFRKIIAPLRGKPLIAYTIEAAEGSRMISRAIVSTEDSEIASVARKWGGEVPFMRPAHLATDSASQMDVILHAITEIEAAEHRSYEILVLLQPTAPLRTSRDIDDALRLLASTGADSVISLCRAEESHPYYMYTVDGDRARAFVDVPADMTRRQDFPVVYVRNGAIYAVRRDVVVRKKSFYGRDCRAFIMPRGRSVNINSLLDWEIAEWLLERATSGDIVS